MFTHQLAHVQLRPLPLQAAAWYCIGTEPHHAGAGNPAPAIGGTGGMLIVGMLHPQHCGLNCIEPTGV